MIKRARARQRPKRRITKLVKEGRPCLLFQRDTIVIYRSRVRRRILNAVDHATELGSEIQRFIERLGHEWLCNSNLSLDPEKFSPGLTEWLIEYNFNRPHQSLGYLAPIGYIERELAKINSPVLPM